MKKHLILILSALALVSVSCEEFEPVYTLKYDDPAPLATQTLTPTHTIRQLAAMYKTTIPWTIDQNIIIAGKVSTTDQPGNFYKSFYIQDETGGMEIKMGRSALYNDYLPGQTVYVKCLGLTLGMYGYKSGSYGGQGMVQVGYSDPSGSYETSYLESPLIIDAHVIRGAYGDPVQPEVIKESDLPKPSNTQATNKYLGKLVTLKDLYYGHQAFVLLYLDYNKNTKESSNRIFVSDDTWGVTTWAMSQTKMTEYITSGVWDEISIGNAGDYNYGKVGDLKGDGTYPGVQKSAYSVSQYFSMGNTEIQVRTSGYSKFGDLEIPEDVRSGQRAIDITGILTLYQGSIQFVVNSEKDFVYSDTHKPLYE